MVLSSCGTYPPVWFVRHGDSGPQFTCRSCGGRSFPRSGRKPCVGYKVACRQDAACPGEESALFRTAKRAQVADDDASRSRVPWESIEVQGAHQWTARSPDPRSDTFRATINLRFSDNQDETLDGAGGSPLESRFWGFSVVDCGGVGMISRPSTTGNANHARCVGRVPTRVFSVSSGTKRGLASLSEGREVKRVRVHPGQRA